MTNEEAIERLKGLYGNNYTEQEKALDMAIKALQSDCISREMARRIIDSGRTKEQMLESLKTAPDIVQELKNRGVTE